MRHHFLDVIPTVILFALIIGLLLRPRALPVVVIVLGLAWATVVVFDAGADFLGGFAFGAANAAVGAVLGAGLRTIFREARHPKATF
jgi:hypothetical protein